MPVPGDLDAVDRPGDVHQLVTVIDLGVDAGLVRYTGHDDVADRFRLKFPAAADIMPVKPDGVVLDSARG